MNKTRTLLFAGMATAAMFVGQAWAMPVNQQIDPGAPPPPGWILNLDGLPVAENPSRYVQYTAYFLAAQTTTHITFAMRDDTLAVIFLDSIAVADVSSPGVNLIRNGGFEDGTVPSGGNTNAPVNWRYANPHSAPFESTVSCGGYGQGGSGCAWGSGTDTAYDLITQSVATVVGDEYQLSFWAFADASASGHFWKELNGACCGKFPQPSGDAFDIVAYAGNLPAGIVPEPTALGMFGFGALLIGGFLVLRRREQPRARRTRIVVSGVRAQSVHYLTRTSTAVMLSRPPPSSAASSR